MRYKTVFIDWDDTLSNSRFWDRWVHDGVNFERYRLAQEALFRSTKGKQLIRYWMLGIYSSADILQYLNKTTSIPYDELASELRYSTENMEFIDVHVIARIKELRKSGTKVVIATDNMDTLGALLPQQ